MQNSSVLQVSYNQSSRSAAAARQQCTQCSSQLPLAWGTALPPSRLLACTPKMLLPSALQRFVLSCWNW
jgi:hypothetical protein